MLGVVNAAASKLGNPPSLPHSAPCLCAAPSFPWLTFPCPRTRGCPFPHLGVSVVSFQAMQLASLLPPAPQAVSVSEARVERSSSIHHRKQSLGGQGRLGRGAEQAATKKQGMDWGQARGEEEETKAQALINFKILVHNLVAHSIHSYWIWMLHEVQC
ncbi:unnamed protein product [Natator depressus]